MAEWKQCKLSEIADIIMGQSPKSDYYNTEGKGIPFLQGNRTFGMKYPFFDTWTTKVTKEAQAGDVIMSVRAPVGALNITTENVCLGRGVCGLRMKNGRQDFLFYLMKFSMPQLLNKETGTIFGSVNRNDISNLTVLVPEDNVQDMVSHILKNIDDKIENNNKINRNLLAMSKAYFEELFVRRALPNWKVGTLSEIGTIVAGGTPSKIKEEYYTDCGIAWITPKDLSVDKSVFISHGEKDITELGLKKSSAIMMPAGSVLFSSRAPIGYIAIAANDVTTNQGFKSVVPKENVGTAYIYFLLQQLLPTIESMASGSTFKEISGSAMKIVPTVIPDDDALTTFDEFCKPMMKQIQKNEQASRYLVELRDSVLPKLMSGEIDISELDIIERLCN